MAELSIFDLDRTITRQGSWSFFLLFAAMRLNRWRIALVPAVIGAMTGYKLGFFSRKRLKEIMHRLMLGQKTERARLHCVAQAFTDQLLKQGVCSQAVDRIKAEQQAGRTVMIATASPHFYADILAEKLGVNWVVATRSVWDGDCVTPRIAFENCYGAAKLGQIKAALRDHAMDRSALHIRFFSDDLSDQPCFDWADEPYAVNPSLALSRHARQKGWPMLVWR